MILLDTNLISEPLRPAPHPGVIAWIDAQPLETLFLSAVTVAELRAGIASLPAGKRRETLRERVESQVLPVFTGRVLAFDLAAMDEADIGADLLLQGVEVRDGVGPVEIVGDDEQGVASAGLDAECVDG